VLVTDRVRFLDQKDPIVIKHKIQVGGRVDGQIQTLNGVGVMAQTNQIQVEMEKLENDLVPCVTNLVFLIGNDHHSSIQRTVQIISLNVAVNRRGWIAL
tara:strand:+ start:10 stop:306 length:297 start_codon:yes stop_codon:yes gene_type:complete